MIKISKKINGTFYVVEAVFDSSYKKMWVVSAYIRKDGVTQVSDVENTTPNGTPETHLPSPPSNNSIPKNKEVVKKRKAPSLLKVGERQLLEQLIQSGGFVHSIREEGSKINRCN